MESSTKRRKVSPTNAATRVFGMPYGPVQTIMSMKDDMELYDLLEHVNRLELQIYDIYEMVKRIDIVDLMLERGYPFDRRYEINLSFRNYDWVVPAVDSKTLAQIQQVRRDLESVVKSIFKKPYNLMRKSVSPDLPGRIAWIQKRIRDTEQKIEDAKQFINDRLLPQEVPYETEFFNNQIGLTNVLEVRPNKRADVLQLIRMDEYFTLLQDSDSSESSSSESSSSESSSSDDEFL
jgi:hypothetical protein